jgi:hypothetical protein
LKLVAFGVERAQSEAGGGQISTEGGGLWRERVGWNERG